MPETTFSRVEEMLEVLPAWLSPRSGQDDEATRARRGYAAGVWNALVRWEGDKAAVISPTQPAWKETLQQVADVHHVPGMTEGPGLDEPVFIRGNPHRTGEVAARGFLEAITGGITPVEASSSGRREVAEWILHPENPLTMRVYVNRVWHHVFGRGLVASTDDFGVLGTAPDIPELLDALAAWFVGEGKGATKSLLRLLLLSDAFALGNEPVADSIEKDPTNRFWHHMPTRRMEAEIIRDSVLSVAGVLDRTIGGPPVPIHLTAFMDGRGKPGKNGPLDGARRRTVYIEIRRNFLSPTLLGFDMPMPSTTIGNRTRSNVPAQSLTLLNDPFFQEMAAQWSSRIRAAHPDPAARISAMTREAFARAATPEDIELCLSFLAQQTEAAKTAGIKAPEETAWTDLAHAFFNLKEFIYIP